MLKILVQWILHKIQNHLSQCRLDVQLDICIFGALSPIRHSSNDRCPSVRPNELLRPSSLLHRSPLSYFWLWSSSHAEMFSNFTHSLSTAAFAAGNVHSLRHKNKFEPNRNFAVNCPHFLQCGLHDDSVKILPYASLVDSLASKKHANFDLKSLVLPRVPPCLLFLHVLQCKAGANGVSKFLRTFLMVSLKYIPHNFLALSSFDLSCDHFCLSFSLGFFHIFVPELSP